MNASSKGVSLGIMNSSALEPGGGPSQPFVDLMGRKVRRGSLSLHDLDTMRSTVRGTIEVLPQVLTKLYESANPPQIPVLSTQTGAYRAISHGTIADPQTAFSYIQRSFRQQTGAVVGAMRLLAHSFASADELNQVGFALYADFRPEVGKWGERAEMRLKDILDLRRRRTDGQAPVGEEAASADTSTTTMDAGAGTAEPGLRVVKVEDEQGKVKQHRPVLSLEQDEDVKPSIEQRAAVIATTSQEHDVGPQQNGSDSTGQTAQAIERDEFDALLDEADDEAFATLDV